MIFRDRSDAGIRLAEELTKLRLEDPVVLGMARGGIPVGFEVARALDAPLDVIVVRKLGHPSQPELGLGALAEGGVRMVNEALVEHLKVPDDLIERVAAREELELNRRISTYRGDRRPVQVRDRNVIVVDDGLATGFTALAAVHALRRRGARRVVLAVPVAPPGAVATLGAVADDVVCLEVTERFFGLSEWYADFRQVSDEEVVDLLAASATDGAEDEGVPSSRSGEPYRVTQFVEIPADGNLLPGELGGLDGATGLVLFAHGSGSSRLSPRNLEVAAALRTAGLVTLLFDLLTEAEASSRDNVFDISLLASRVEKAAIWARNMLGESSRNQAKLPIGFFGASTGAAAALVAAAHLGDVAAVVSRGGRPDLAGTALSSVTAPTLLIVGGADESVLALNREAQSLLRVENRLEIVQGATHLFEEPGALEKVSRLASEWFVSHFRS